MYSAQRRDIQIVSVVSGKLLNPPTEGVIGFQGVPALFLRHPEQAENFRLCASVGLVIFQRLDALRILALFEIGEGKTVAKSCLVGIVLGKRTENLDSLSVLPRLTQQPAQLELLLRSEIALPAQPFKFLPRPRPLPCLQQRLGGHE